MRIADMRHTENQGLRYSANPLTHKVGVTWEMSVYTTSRFCDWESKDHSLYNLSIYVYTLCS